MKLVSALAVLVALAITAASASAETIATPPGVVQAQLDFSRNATTGADQIDRLRISRSGVIVFDGALTACGAVCFLGLEPGDPLTLSLTDLEADGEVEIVVNGYTGGAACCTIAAVFAFDPASGTYRETGVDFGYSPFKIFDLDMNGRPEMHSGDSRFSGRFTPRAYSVMPVRIQHFERGTTIDVSKQFRSVLRQDLSMLRRVVERESRADRRGYWAALAADKCRLSGVRSARRELDRAAAAGKLKRRGGFGKGGRAFVKDLFGFLHKIDYC